MRNCGGGRTWKSWWKRCSRPEGKTQSCGERALYAIIACMNKTVTASEARNDFFSILKEIKTPGVSVMITYEGHPAGVLISADEFEGWMETMDILSHPEEAADILERLHNKDKERTVTLEEFKKDLGIE